MSDKFFLDSNICLYCFDSNVKKQSIALNLLASHPTISTQVLHETAAVCIRKWSILPQKVTAIIRQLIARCDVVVLPATMSLRALDLLPKYGFSWWDALIVAAAQDAGCTILYSEDLQDGLQVGNSLIVRNPFL